MKKSAEKATEKAAKVQDKVNDEGSASSRELALRFAVEAIQAHRDGSLGDDALSARCLAVKTMLECSEAIQLEREADLEEREAAVADRQVELEERERALSRALPRKSGGRLVGNVGSWELFVR